ncbi:unnamed protein product [Urochloa decumbens]|uniref:VWFA domain-containing protein n=1 Tax=Urochloa decumbens TaxID=240449 RepID=A0ABC9BKE4_9POAL
MAPAGEAQLAKVYHNTHAPLTDNKQKVLVKFTAPETPSGDTAEVDFVFVLDTSGSMGGSRLKQMHAAMDFVLGKLGDNDKIAIVNFSSEAHTNGYNAPKPFDENKKDAKKLVDGLHAKGDTNIEEGLRAAIKILDKGRRGWDKKRASCIFLMSDGVQNRGDARKVFGELPNWTVHTFGFGEKHDETLLWEIAQKSHAGVYHHVLDEGEVTNYLTKAFASLALYRSISVMGLQVTLIPKEEAKYTIVHVDAGGYHPDHPKDSPTSWTIHFGDLAREENRRVLVELKVLGVSKKEDPKPVIEVKYAYTYPANKKNHKERPEEMKGPKHPLFVKIGRDDAKASPDMNPDVQREEARNKQADYIEEMFKLADKEKKVDGAKRKLSTAKNELSGLDDPKGEFVLDALHAELGNIGDFLKSYDVYKKLGRAYMLSCLS